MKRTKHRWNITIEQAGEKCAAVFADSYSELYRTPLFDTPEGAISAMRGWFTNETIMGAPRFTVHFPGGRKEQA